MPTAINPQTGERLELKGGQWVSVEPPKRPAPPQGFEQQQPSFLENTGRQLGLTLRHGVEGAMGLPSILAEIPRQALNLIPGVDLPPQQQAISQLLTNLGVPSPESTQERIVGGASQALAGGGSLLGPAQALTGQIPKLTSKVIAPRLMPLTATPAAQATSAIAGGAAGPTTKEMGAGPVLQTLSSLAASMASPAAVSGAQRSAKDILQKVMTPGAGPRKAAEKMVESALKRDLIPEDAVLEAHRLGREANLVDVSGPNVRQLAQTVSSVPGKAKTVAEATLKARANRSVARMTSDLKRFAGTDKEVFQTTKSILQDRLNTAAPLYKEANNSLLQVDDDLSTLLLRPAMQKAFRNGVTKAQNDPDWPAEIIIPKDVKPGKTIPLAALDYTKRSLDDKIGAAIRAGKMDDARILNSLKNQLLRVVDDKVPVYREAREAFSDRSAMLKAMEIGKKILRSEPDEMMEFLADMPASEKEMFTIGALKSITDKLKTTVEGANAARRIATDLVKERIRPAFPDDESFSAFVSGLERENVFMQTKGILGGSPTQQRLQTAGQLAGEAADIVASPATGTLSTIRRFLTREKGIPEKVRDEIGEILFSEAVANPRTFSGKIMRRLAAHKVPKSRVQSLLDSINTGTIGAISTQENNNGQ